MPYLIFQNHTGKETIAVPGSGELNLGRTNTNDITIVDDPLVSRKHCVIYLHPVENKFILKDLNSSNGTQINGETLYGEEAFLSEGDMIRVGNAEFVFCIENPERYQSTTTSIMKLGKSKDGANANGSSKPQFNETLKLNRAESPGQKDDTVISPGRLDSSSSLPPGMEINGYRIVRTVSSSEKATVYLAFQESVKRTVIMKIFSVRADMEAKVSFRELVQKIGRLAHSNIVHYFDCGTIDDYCYLVMAFMSEGNLEERISRQAPFTEKEALTMIRKIAEALNYAMSEHCLIHLCLKPETVLFGDSGEPVVANIGLGPWIARNYQHKRTYVFGNPVYMSPEQAIDHRADWRSDLYSLGIMFYEMLTGKAPFTAPDEKAMIDKHVSSPVVFPPNLSKEAVSIIRTMTAKDPEGRFNSWDSFLQALKPLDDSRQAQPESPKTAQKPQ
ncbi:MAG: FHA domain-containing serine/threonine-protein kinase, partial [Victivallales bacterium]